jgi:hypothetical protein
MITTLIVANCLKSSKFGNSVIPLHISDIRDTFKFTAPRELSEVYPNEFILLSMITVPVASAATRKSF